ncbi:hypothetical protein H310_13605 [Aphanomyces invadans]|uniref:Peptidase A2 domain-containing protein n=1 Tax=Aphanomyces invadans TaxID=157072 RepID=A0A024TEF1_9STRA|nr:hypothetical protein H310_13605 [Aphanomyces invadans]ETV91956.1 hypothetical protein H310_13605 [Aphanomyces invadans]|eukprot:XP_008879380.1 hypothetical protein H310_13605 [Aphanomyces invadans]
MPSNSMAVRLEQESARQAVITSEIENSRREQEESRAILSKQQEQLRRQQEEIMLAMAQQARHSKVEELDKKVRRNNVRWGLFAAATNERPPAQAAPAVMSRSETLMGVQQVPLAPMYKGSTKRERREFMDEYHPYFRRVEALNRGIVPRVCEHDFGKPIEEITEDEWRDYFLSAQVHELDLDWVAKAMAPLKMDMRIRDAESRVGRLLADFYEKLEQLDVVHLPSQEPKQSVKILTAAIQPAALKATVERQLAQEANKVYKTSVSAFGRWLIQLLDNFMLFESQMYGEKYRQPQQRKPDGQAKGVVPAKQVLLTKGCLKCGSDDHKVVQCPKCAPGEAHRLLEQRAKRPLVAANTPAAAPSSVPAAKKNVVCAAIDSKKPKLEAPQAPRTVRCSVNDMEALALLDSGADQSVVSPALFARLKEAGALLAPVCKLDSVLELGRFMEEMKLSVDREIKLKLTFDTDEGRLVLTNLTCWLAAAPLHSGLGDIIVSRAVMASLGYSPIALLEAARRAQNVYDLSQLGDQNSCLMAAIKVLEDKKQPPIAPEEAELNVDEELSCFPQVDVDWSVDDDKAAVLKEKVGECRVAGCDDDYAVELGRLLVKYEDVFRLKLGRDPPVKVEPLRVTLKADTKPVRCKARRYSKEQREFMARHVEQLQAAGYAIAIRGRSVDVRPVNAQTERILWPMPMLEVILDHLCGAKVFFTLDFFKGYWQFALHPDSQEMFSFLTDIGVYTPTRVLMGSTDSVLPVIYDLLGYSKNKDGLLAVLERVLKICEFRGLKLNPTKCRFYQTEALWCGRVVPGEGVKHDPPSASRRYKI